MLSPKEQSFVDIIVGIEKGKLVEETLLFLDLQALEPGGSSLVRLNLVDVY
jgi:hypothetical protein